MSSTVAVTLTVLSVLNLTVLLGVAYRLRHLTLPAPVAATGSAFGAGAADDMWEGLPVPGTEIPHFTAVTTEGHELTEADLTGPTLVGFFTTGCPPCKAMAPEFAAAARVFPGGRDRVLAVVVGGPGDPAAFAAELNEIAQAVAEKSLRAPVVAAFGVRDFPAVCLLERNVVTAAAWDLDTLRMPQDLTPPLPASRA